MKKSNNKNNNICNNNVEKNSANKVTVEMNKLKSLISSECSEEQLKVDEDDDDLFLKKKIEEIQVYAKNEKENQERLQTLKQQSLAEKAVESNSKKAKFYSDSGKYKNKWFSKMTEDEYDDFIVKTKSEHLQKLSKLRNNYKKAHALDFENYLKEKAKLETSKNKEEEANNLKNNNNDNRNNQSRKKVNFLESSSCCSKNKIEKSNLGKIDEEIKSPMLTTFSDVKTHENFKTILNAQSMKEQELSSSYVFGTNNVLVHKENEDQISVCASKTISKNKSKSKSQLQSKRTINNANATVTAFVADNCKNKSSNLLLDKDNKDNNDNSCSLIKAEKENIKGKVLVNGNKKKSNPLELIKFNEKNAATAAQMKLKTNKNETNNNNNVCCKIINKSKYLEKKEKFANFKKFQKLKKLSHLVSNAKSNHMRNLKVDFIIQQQTEKENKEKLLREYLEEENKIMESNNIENENFFQDENHIALKMHRNIRSFVRYKDIPKLDSTMLQNTIYQSKVNQINFLQDSYLVPDFRSKFIRYPENYEEILVDENLIEKFSKLFLNYNKQTYQKDLDENKKKLEEIGKETFLKFNDNNAEVAAEANFPKPVLRNRKNDLFQENYKKFKNTNYQFLYSFKFKYNRKNIVEFPSEKVKDIIENCYEINTHEKEEKESLTQFKMDISIKAPSEDFCLNNINDREQDLQKFLKCYGIDVE